MNRILNRQLDFDGRTAATVNTARAGVTLSEVLISMLIMSIGVVSLATLFPISVLRTAQATQLTHSVFLRNNAEAFVESNLGLLNNFNIATGTNAVMDPLGAFNVGGSLGGIVNRTSGGIATLQSAEQFAGLPDSWTLDFEDIVTGVTATQVTTNTNATTKGLTPRNGQNPTNARYRIVMYDVTGKLGVIKDLFQVVSNFSLSWQNVDGMGNPLPASSLPAGFTPAKIRVESQAIRYSYLLTVRKKAIPTIAGEQSWVADVDVAVFFNRLYLPSGSGKAGDETPFSLTFPVNGTVAGALPTRGTGLDAMPGVRGVDDDANGTVDDASELGWPGSDDNRTVLVPLPVTKAGPYLKKGSYMLETSMLKWYRVVDFNKTTGVVLLDQDVRFAGTTAANPILNGIFMKGIVDVFPLGSRTGQQ